MSFPCLNPPVVYFFPLPSFAFSCYFFLMFLHLLLPSFLTVLISFPFSFLLSSSFLSFHPSLPTLLNTKSSILPASLSHSTQEFLFPFLVCLSLFYCFYCFYCSSTTFPFSCHFLL
uniref:Uncharacterized protein n=1 Tax=Cacopsylla melanoneura TaxID=428564 RepID=A0A8D9BAA5_9HEMI